jgi:hypothetical protein
MWIALAYDGCATLASAVAVGFIWVHGFSGSWIFS